MQTPILIVWVLFLGAALVQGDSPGSNTAIGALKKSLHSPIVTKKTAAILTKKSLNVAKQGVVLKKIGKQLKKHAAIAPLKKSHVLKKTAKKVQRAGKQKIRAAVAITKTALPTTLKKLHVIKKSAASPLKKKAAKMIIRSLAKPHPHASSPKVRKAMTKKTGKAVKHGKRAVKQLKQMKKAGLAVHPKRAKAMVKKAMGKKGKGLKGLKKSGKKAILKKLKVLKKTGMSPKAVKKILKKTGAGKKSLKKMLKKSGKKTMLKKLGVSPRAAKMIKKAGKKAILKKKLNKLQMG